MVRYTLALSGPPINDASTMSVTEHIVDIFNDEQLEEWFLCNVNPKGQVRAIVFLHRVFAELSAQVGGIETHLKSPGPGSYLIGSRRTYYRMRKYHTAHL